MNSSDSKNWELVMIDEINSLRKNKNKYVEVS